MSLLEKKWKFPDEDKKLSFQEKILRTRAFDPSAELALHDPFLMKNMERAVTRIKQAIEKNERIMVYGDYDVDGMSGAAILIRTLRHMKANVSYRLPKRAEDGYGLHEKFIQEFEKLGVGLVITVDCGISGADEISLAKQKNIDVIVTDHHTIPENFPDDAFAVLHPLQKDCSYPFKGLTGAGVAFKLAQALLDGDGLHDILFDLAAMGTLADLGPLIDENRLIVKKGLECLQHTAWPGIRHLKRLAGIKDNEIMDTHHIGFRLAPRLNAAGRLSDPLYALQLLLADDGDSNAEKFAKQLDKLNVERQKMLEKALEEARIMVSRQHRKIFIAAYKDWHVGILGLIAGKISEEFGVPAFVMQEGESECVGSARSPKNFHVTSALQAQKPFLKTFGGHAQAAGFTALRDQLPAFQASLEKYAEETLDHTDPTPELLIDAELLENDITLENANFIELFAPFGIGNPQPTLCLHSAKIVSARTVGKDQKHLKATVALGKKNLDLIGFNFGKHVEIFTPGAILDLCGHLEKNIFNGKTSLQLKLLDASVC